ncbi:hypothetical protein J6590_090416, partial [Homalodisca vitripennis]
MEEHIRAIPPEICIRRIFQDYYRDRKSEHSSGTTKLVTKQLLLRLSDSSNFITHWDQLTSTSQYFSPQGPIPQFSKHIALELVRPVSCGLGGLSYLMNWRMKACNDTM